MSTWSELRGILVVGQVPTQVTIDGQVGDAMVRWGQMTSR